MDKVMFISEFWRNVITQDRQGLSECFNKNARVRWINSNEEFNREEYIRANCEYPGEWAGEVERIEILDKLIISIAHIYLRDNSMSFHVTSFFELENDKVQNLDEYWGDDTEAPEWRKALKIGKKIK